MNTACYGFALAVNMGSNSPSSSTLRFARLVDAGLTRAQNEGRLAEYKHDLIDMIVEAVEDKKAGHAAVLAFALAAIV